MSKHGCEGNERIFSAYVAISKHRLSSRDGSLASTHRHSTWDVLYAPVASPRAWLCMGSSLRRYDGLADPYTARP